MDLFIKILIGLAIFGVLFILALFLDTGLNSEKIAEKDGIIIDKLYKPDTSGYASGTDSNGNLTTQHIHSPEEFKVVVKMDGNFKKITTEADIYFSYKTNDTVKVSIYRSRIFKIRTLKID